MVGTVSVWSTVSGTATPTEVRFSCTPSEPGGRNLLEGAWVTLPLERYLGGPLEPRWAGGVLARWSRPCADLASFPSALALGSQQPHLCPLCAGSQACPGCWVSPPTCQSSPRAYGKFPELSKRREAPRSARQLPSVCPGRVLAGGGGRGGQAGVGLLFHQRLASAFCALGLPQCQEALPPAST